jgi:hypothetical protein
VLYDKYQVPLGTRSEGHVGASLDRGRLLTAPLTMVSQGKVAFVAGANGISGNAIIEYLIRTPHTEWSSIIISSRSPLKYFWQDPRVKFVALDFLAPLQDVLAKMDPLCRNVTHAFFTSYVHVDDFSKLKEHNTPLFENFLNAIDTVAGGNLQRVCLQTGGKVGVSRF